MWALHHGREPHFRSIGGPEEGDGVIPCPALIDIPDDASVPEVHVAYELNEIELAALAQGGTLWLSTLGGLPIHRLQVIEKGGTP